MFEDLRERDRHWLFTRIIAWKHGARVLTYAGTVAATLGAFAWPSHRVVAIGSVVIGVLVVVLADVANDTVRASVDALRERDAQHEQQLRASEKALRTASGNHRRVVRVLLRAIAGDLGLAETERVNVYKIDRLMLPSGDSRPGFTRMGRYSKNATFDSDGRHFYPFSEGILRAGWESGFCSDECPHPRGKAKHFSYMKNKFRIPDATARKMRMQPVGLVAMRLDSSSGEGLGIVCVESICQNRIDAKRVKTVVSEHSNLLVALLENDVSLSTSSGAGL